jgi:hypothetical protein
MTRILKSFDEFLFKPLPAERLSILRILIGSFVLFYLGSRYEMLTRMAASDAQLFAPVGMAWFLKEPLNPAVFQVLLAATLGANVAFIAGLFHRLIAPVFALLLLFLLCYRNSWSMIYHSDNVMVFHILILSVAPSAAAISIDAWRRRAGRTRQPDWQFGWPVQLMCAVTALSYFLAGIAKVAGESGWTWASGQSLRSQIAVDALRKELLGDGAPELAFLLYDQIPLFTFIGVSSLILELGAPFALARVRMSQFWALGAFGMHWGIYFIMDILFRYQLAGLIFLPFLPIERPFAAAATAADWLTDRIGLWARRSSVEGRS